jgi:hypothetical protein
MAQLTSRLPSPRLSRRKTRTSWVESTRKQMGEVEDDVECVLIYGLEYELMHSPGAHRGGD